MAWAIWITGLPGSGKSAISRRVRAHLSRKGIKTKILSSDEIRKTITPNPTYSEEERDIVYSSLAYMAMLLTKEGRNVIIDATANRQRYRDLARKLIPQFAEVYVKCPLEVCMKRELRRKGKGAPKDIYKKSQKQDATVPGVNVPYEESRNPEVIVDSQRYNIEENARKIAKDVTKLFRA